MTNIELTREIIGNDIYVDKKTLEIITPLDLSGLVGVFTDNEVTDIIQMYSSLPDNEEKALKLLNEVFLEAIRYLKDELLYENKEFGSVLKTNFTTLKSFHDFLRSTKNKKGKIKCTIIKHM